MQTRREYAISLGLAKPTRGRMSREAHEAIAKAEAGGMVFSDTEKPAAKVEKETTGEAKPVPADPRDSSYLLPSDFRFPEAEYVAVSRDENGKRVVHTVREVCCTCRVSLTNHMCDSPTILGDIVVKIEKR